LAGGFNLKTMKVLFVDFDGVLNILTFHHTDAGFSPSACANLQLVLSKDPNARIVVSSSWRRLGLVKVREILKENGIDATKVIGITDEEGGFTPERRAEQIDRWLKNHKDVKKFAVLDDYPMPKYADQYVKCNGYVGFTQKDAEIALKILNHEDR
jgi:HAD domain in Swiss Army Knife RNA repair proteins